MKKTVLEIDLNALEHNFNVISSKLKPSTKFMAIVKAGGYGSDSVEIAKKLESIGVDYFAVAFTNEGIDLREAGIKTPILVLLPQVESIKNIIDYNLEASLYSFYFLENFIDYIHKKEINKSFCHFKINTGLNRVGFSEYEISDAVEKINRCKPIKLVGIYSHLAATDDLNETKFTNSQINLFKKVSSEIKSQITSEPILHMSNTSGIFNYPECEFDMVRAGIGLYGYNNYLNKELLPVHSLKSVIAQIIHCNKGESVGYNRSYICKEDTKIAVIPIGHADGISRSFSKNIHIMIDDKKAEVVGDICMDVLMVNIKGINCDEGDEVTFFDSKFNAEDFAKSVSTISYEILTNLSERIERKIIEL